MCIVHNDNFNKTEYQHYIDEPYFRLIHSLQDLSIQVLPQGYSLATKISRSVNLDKAFFNAS